MKKIFLLACICLAVSCSSYKDIPGVDHNMKKVRIGMSKKKVVSIMGNDYDVLSSKDGIYTLGYQSPGNGVYKLVFADGKLREWNKEWHRRKPSVNHANNHK